MCIPAGQRLKHSRSTRYTKEFRGEDWIQGGRHILCIHRSLLARSQTWRSVTASHCTTTSIVALKIRRSNEREPLTPGTWIIEVARMRALFHLIAPYGQSKFGDRTEPNRGPMEISSSYILRSITSLTNARAGTSEARVAHVTHVMAWYYDDHVHPRLAENLKKFNRLRPKTMMHLTISWKPYMRLSISIPGYLHESRTCLITHYGVLLGHTILYSVVFGS